MVPWRVQIAHVGALVWARLVLIFALAVQRWPPKKKKKFLLRIFSNFAWWFVAPF